MNYFTKTMLFAVMLGILSALIINLPYLYNPYSMPLSIAVLKIGFFLDISGRGGTPMMILMTFISFTIPVVLFLLWQPRLLVGAKDIPVRSKYIFLLAAILSVVFCVYSVPNALSYLGDFRTVLLLIYALLPIILIIIAWVRLNKPTGYMYNLVFHFVGFLWLINLAFPWLGEMF